MANITKRLFRFSSILKIASLISFGAMILCYLAPFIHPKTLSILPFFGLLYPVLLGVNIAWLVIWGLARSKWAIYALVILGLGGKMHLRSFALSTNETADPKGLKILTYNVRLFDLFNPTYSESIEHRNQIFEYIRRTDPDVLCLQEYYRQDKPTNFEVVDSLFAIMGNRNYHERSAHKRSTRQNYGIAMFSKYPIISKGDVMFESQGCGDFNYCIYADIIKNQDTFRVYNVHLQSIRLNTDPNIEEPTEDETLESERIIRNVYSKLRLAYLKRAEQARRVVEHIKSSPYPVIVCGDFNDTPMSYTYNQFNLFLKDAFRQSSSGFGSTYIGRLPAGRIDYLFYDADLRPSGFHIQSEELSDHRALVCTFSRVK
ncbi:MAG: endonuclease/exonuclease/phosphatase family protein [Crocinitomicaceae bacterium]|jgi:endonuclease/exonuclease/phosphatase family metal-dependent hydrolase|nr:endonuclease/exonuclease/phosphatase family protein [Crocinitomicaceae bacterium]MDP4761434.1 endonuclease/exonuclease/phosphatase family protein [Crocinitomicaceae bacterium]